ncbi:MAG TPA: hypothetical protein VFF16_11540 [Telluria sp.]|nr:hypothetical protein [Telluria sp.]
MAKLLFDGHAHILTLLDDEGKRIASWEAYNNVDRHATLRFVPNRRYVIQDRAAPFPHRASANGPYGLYGIIRFCVPGHPGIGVHSGRSASKILPGPQHPTMGCIRTSDDAMLQLRQYMKEHPLSIIEVQNNSAWRAHAASKRLNGRPLQAGVKQRQGAR